MRISTESVFPIRLGIIIIWLADPSLWLESSQMFKAIV